MNFPGLSGVIARSKVANGVENAWVALKIIKNNEEKFVVAVHYKHKDFGFEAFSRANKHAMNLAASLDVAYASKRDANAAKFVKTKPKLRANGFRPIIVDTMDWT